MSASTKKSSSWHPLPLTTSIRSAPSLLVKTSCTSSSYTVHITDLVRVWSESLDRSQILSRATKSSTTIDPAEDASQLSLLLEKLEVGLSGGSDLSELALSCVPRRSNADVADVGDLKLRLAIDLPPPLPELEWTFMLRLGTQMDFTNVFVMPLVALAGLQAAQIESLKTAIKDKDHAIDKMKDALEDNKVRVDVVVGPRRRKALIPFDEVAWDKNMRDGEAQSGAEVVRSVYASRDCGEGLAVQAFKQQTSEWWRGFLDDEDDSDDGDASGRSADAVRKRESPALPVAVKEESKATPKKKERSKKPVAPVGSETESDEDGFEPLKTPPPPAARGRYSKRKIESDSDDEVPPPRPPPQTPPRRAIGKLVGKRKAKSSTPEPARPPPPAPPAPPVEHEMLPDVAMADAGDETTGDEDDLDAGVRPSLPLKSAIEDPPATKRAAGRIGGRKPQPSPPAPGLSATAADSGRGKQSPQKPNAPSASAAGVGGGGRKSIGRIGGRPNAKLAVGLGEGAEDAAAAAASSSVPQSSHRVAPSRVKSPSPEPEDEDEKADRKRRELQKELEAKKKAPPKKKRRF